MGSGVKEQNARAQPHPLIGALRGTVTIAPGTDLTQPADPEWVDRLDAHATEHDVARVVARLAEGEQIALVTDVLETLSGPAQAAIKVAFAALDDLAEPPEPSA